MEKHEAILKRPYDPDYFHKGKILFACLTHQTRQISIIRFSCDTADSHPLEVWDAEEDLHHRAEVASVAQIFDARVPGTKHGLQLHSRLLDHLPLADPWPGVIFPVMSVLRLLDEERLRYVNLDLITKDFPPQQRGLTLFCICSMSIPKCDKWSDIWGSNTASSSSKE